MRADAVASGSSASKSATPRRRAQGPRVRVVEAWVFTCRFRTCCHVLTGCGRTPVWFQCIALAIPVSYRGIAFTVIGFVSGYRFSDTVSFSKSDAPLGAGHRKIDAPATTTGDACYCVLLMYSTPRASRCTWTGSCTGLPKMYEPGWLPPLYKFVIRRT